MCRTVYFVFLVVAFAFSVPAAEAKSSCPVTLVSAVFDAGAVTVTFRNNGKLVIRQLEFNCHLIHAKAAKQEKTPCREENGLFFPGNEYTVSYPYANPLRKALLVSLRSVTLSDGYIWKPAKGEACRVLRIDPRIDPKRTKNQREQSILRARPILKSEKWPTLLVCPI
jgi:hypothetical protein